MKKRWPLVVIVAALIVAWSQRAALTTTADRRPRAEPTGSGGPAARPVSGEGIAAAYSAHRSNVQVTGAGVVLRLLADDNDGSRHQRFILRLADGQTVLVAHNIDLAPRLKAIARDDTLRFSGEYEWNENGGVIHWTHRDPAGRHTAGWLEHDGHKVQ